MVKKNNSGSNSGAGPTDPNLVGSTPTPVTAPPLPIGSHLAPLVSDGGGNGHTNGDSEVDPAEQEARIAATQRNVAAPALKLVGGIPPLEKPNDDDDQFLEKFRSKKSAALANVESNTDALPHHRIADARDFVRLHNDPAYWSHELCFCIVPVKGAKKGLLHLIDEELAMEHLQPPQILRYRLALATKPFNSFFLCEVPTNNMDNTWNHSNAEACEAARVLWTMVTSRRAEGVEKYLTTHARNPRAFPEIEWPKVSLGRIIRRTFDGQLNISREDHAGLRRLVGEAQDLT
jgi:hypothetical protein